MGFLFSILGWVFLLMSIGFAMPALCYVAIGFFFASILMAIAGIDYFDF